MESTLTISVAIATYNRAAMVAKTITEALNQTRRPMEVIVADDASTDETAAMLAIYSRNDGRLRTLRQRENSGGVRNWNAAIRETTGDLIAWCSDDDWFCPDHLRNSAAYLEAHPEVGLVHSHFIDSIESRAGLATRPRPLRSASPILITRENLLAYMIRYYNWPFHPSTIVMRREVWKTVGEFDPEYSLADTDWFVRAAEKFTIAMLPVYGVYNRRHPRNWSNRVGSAEMQREIYEIVDRSILRTYPSLTLHPQFRRVLWRCNVRLRLLLTIQARVRSGHAEAAESAWRVLSVHTGLCAPEWLQKCGRWCIRHLAGFGSTSFDDVSEQVSPL